MHTKLTVPDLKEIFKQASEIANEVPESMREAAFNRALDLLTGGSSQSNAKPEGQLTAKKNHTRHDSSATAQNSESAIETLLQTIDSTQHPGITSNAKVLDRALMVLQIALNDHHVDGLTPPEISKILTDKFRIATTPAAVSMALGNVTNLVNRSKIGLGYSYKIMQSGRDYLAHLRQGDSAPSSAKKLRHTKAKKGDKEIAANDDLAQGIHPALATKKKAKTSGKNASKSSGTKIGPKATILGLISSSFFAEARTAPDVQEYLNKKRGFNLGIPQISLVLLRLVREEKLNRDENAEGNYEYRSP